MTTRADVERLSGASRRLVDMAKRDLDALMRMVDLSNPEAARDAVLDVMPDLVREYGDLASMAAAEWYEEVRAAAGVASRHATALSPGMAAEVVQEGVRYAVGHFFGDDPMAALGLLAGMLQRYILYGSRDTVRRNAERDVARPRYARIPTGAKTCAFCEMLASRGFVYHDETKAGMKGLGNEYHNDCDCMVVVEFDADAHHVEGYDPDAMYERYLEARAAAGSDSPKAILAAMRRLFPGQFTDGVLEDA